MLEPERMSDLMKKRMGLPRFPMVDEYVAPRFGSRGGFASDVGHRIIGEASAIVRVVIEVEFIRAEFYVAATRRNLEKDQARGVRPLREGIPRGRLFGICKAFE